LTHKWSVLRDERVGRAGRRRTMSRAGKSASVRSCRCRGRLIASSRASHSRHAPSSLIRGSRIVQAKVAACCSLRPTSAQFSASRSRCESAQRLRLLRPCRFQLDGQPALILSNCWMGRQTQIVRTGQRRSLVLALPSTGPFRPRSSPQVPARSLGIGRRLRRIQTKRWRDEICHPTATVAHRAVAATVCLSAGSSPRSSSSAE